MNNYVPDISQNYGGGILDTNFRIEVLKDNYTFYLDDDKLEELLKKNCTFGRKRNLTFKGYIRSHYSEYKDSLKKVLLKTTSLEDYSDAILLWGNDTRIRNQILDITYYKDQELLANNIYSIYKPKDFQEIKKMLDDEYFLFDTETTGFSKIAQIIEFGGILYNRKIYKNRIKEAREYSKNIRDTVLHLFNYIGDKELSETELFEDIKKISSNKDLDIKGKQDELINLLNIDEDIIRKIELFDFKYNKVIHFYIKPYKDFNNSDVQKIHRISNEKIMEEGKEPFEIVEGLQKFLKNKTIIAHNISFDMNKIVELFNDFDMVLPNITKIVDSINLFQRMNEKIGIFNNISRYNLNYLTKLYLGINADSDGGEEVTSGTNSNQRHTAIYDVKITNQNLKKALSLAIQDKDENIMNDLLLNVNKGIKNLNKKQSKNQASLF